jgi:hypothetical protein
MITNKFYVGMHSTDKLNDTYLGSGKLLMLSVKKYGKHQHKKEVLELLSSREELIEREKDIVNEDLLSDPNCLNLITGGRTYVNLNIAANKNNMKKARAEHFKKLNEDSLYRESYGKSISDSISGENNSFFGKRHNENAKSKISNSHKGKHIGADNCQFGKIWIYNEELKASKIIRKTQLDEFILNGWEVGRKLIFK